MSSTTGTKIDETRSASRWTGAFDPCAASSSRTISDSFVLAPTFVTNTTSRPCPLIDAPTTSLPGPTSTGTDSPVSIERSTHDVPCFTTPSAGIFSPGDDHDDVAGTELIDRHAPFDVAVEDRRLLGASFEQRARRVSCRRTRARLERLADQDQRHDHGGDVEVVAVGVRSTVTYAL